MVEPVRHRQTKGAATDMFYLTLPLSTLHTWPTSASHRIRFVPIVLQKSKLERRRKSPQEQGRDTAEIHEMCGASNRFDQYLTVVVIPNTAASAIRDRPLHSSRR